MPKGPRSVAKSAPRARHIALLRSINVGGKNKLPMLRLAAAFEAAGCTEVETFIQSGNVAFTASPAVMKRLVAHVAKQLATEFDYHVPITVRSASELQRVVDENPFIAAGKDVDTLHVMFLSGRADSKRVATLDPDRSPGDSWEVRGQQIYLCLPNGVGRSKLSNDYFDRKLSLTSTGRNWRTVRKLLELTNG